MCVYLISWYLEAPPVLRHQIFFILSSRPPVVTTTSSPTSWLRTMSTCAVRATPSAGPASTCSPAGTTCWGRCASPWRTASPACWRTSTSRPGETRLTVNKHKHFLFFFLHLSVSCSASFKDTLLNDIRKAREKYQGEELAKELSRIKLRIDNTEVLTQDIVMNLLFSYRDIQVAYKHTIVHTHIHASYLYWEARNNFPVCDHQDYDAMVKLVQTLEMLPTCDLATQPMIQFHYAFALNRYTAGGFKIRNPFILRLQENLPPVVLAWFIDIVRLT